MILLLIDTAGEHGSVALVEANGPNVSLLAHQQMQGRRYSSLLVTAVGAILKDEQLSLKQVDAFSVVNGPGSFTGIRIGVAAVKALAEVTDKPVVALSSLALLASLRNSEADAIALLDAGRGEVYWGQYRERGQRKVIEKLMTLSDVSAMSVGLAAPILACEESIAGWLGDSVQMVPRPGPLDAARLILAALERGETADLIALDANYLRRAEAEIVMEKKQEQLLR